MLEDKFLLILFFMEVIMSLFFYNVDPKYCDFLRLSDSCIPYTNKDKEKRPFVGILFCINDINYFAPLCSPKKKHLTMKNQVDFLKIYNGEWGAINFNNMIPVPECCLTKVNTKLYQSDPKEVLDYKNLLVNQITWCNARIDNIINRANRLYRIICQGTNNQMLIKRCCNFPIVEEQYYIYCEKKELIIHPNEDDYDQER